MSILLYIASGAIALGAMVLIWRKVTKPWLTRWNAYVKQVSTCGYVAPPPTDKALRNLLKVARFLTFIQVGKVKVVGRENLDTVPGPYMFSANHPAGADVMLIPVVLNRKARYMAHETVFTAGFGLGAHIVGPGGAFVAHDNIRDNGVRARAASVKILTSGQTLVLLPEGLTNYDPVMLPLKEGAVRIVKQAALELGKPAFIVPAYIRYGTYPGKWLQRYPRAMQYLIVLLLWPLYRRGAKVVIGKPISSTELASDDAVATALLRTRIEQLDPKSVN